MSAKELIRDEARERYSEPSFAHQNKRRGFIAGRTPTPEQIDSLGKWFLRYHTPTGYHHKIDQLWEKAKRTDAITWQGTQAEPYLRDARDALSAARLVVEPES